MAWKKPVSASANSTLQTCPSRRIGSLLKYCNAWADRFFDFVSTYLYTPLLRRGLRHPVVVLIRDSDDDDTAFSGAAEGVAVMGVTGLLVGWRIRTDVFDATLGFLLLLLFGFAMIWLGIWVGSLMRTVEAVQGLMFTVMFPLTFVANTFAPPENMPSWLRLIAEWNPVSSLAQACRERWGNAPAVGPDSAWPLQHPVLMATVWPLVLTAIFAPLALKAFQRRSRD